MRFGKRSDISLEFALLAERENLSYAVAVDRRHRRRRRPMGEARERRLRGRRRRRPKGRWGIRGGKSRWEVGGMLFPNILVEENQAVVSGRNLLF